MYLKEISQQDYMHYSAKEFAKDHSIIYVPIEFDELKIALHEEYTCPRLLAEDRYIMLHPPNDGMPTCPIEFYKRTKDGGYVKVIDNQHAFKEITNISEILLQIATLYEQCIDEPIFLGSMAFMVMLTGNIDENYHGEGKLAITDETLCNSKVKPEDQIRAKKFFYNEFLDHFIGWNFGKAVNENSQLKNTLQRIIKRLKKASLRKNAGPGFDVWGSKDVWHVDYDDDGTPEIIRF